MVETIRKSTREEREKWIKEAKYNLFLLKSDYVFIDLLTDSGTGAMSDKQWAADILPGNSHFDTTKGHIEYRKAVALDCTIKEAANTELEIPFKGNMDLERLEEVLKTTPREKIPCVVLTVTNNTAGGQPVSMENIKGVSALCKKYGVKLLMDSARFAENAYFIKTREKGYENKSIREIVHEMYEGAAQTT